MADGDDDALGERTTVVETVGVEVVTGELEINKELVNGGMVLDGRAMLVNVEVVVDGKLIVQLLPFDNRIHESLVVVQ